MAQWYSIVLVWKGLQVMALLIQHIIKHNTLVTFTSNLVTIAIMTFIKV